MNPNSTSSAKAGPWTGTFAYHTRPAANGAGLEPQTHEEAMVNTPSKVFPNFYTDEDFNQAISTSMTTQEATNQLERMEFDEHSANPTPRSATLLHPLFPTVFFADDLEGDGADLHRVIERSQHQFEQLHPQLYPPDPGATNHITINSSDAQPHDIPPHLSLFLPDPYASPEVIWRALNFLTGVHEWLSMNPFNHFDRGASFCSLVNEYREYRQSTNHWRTVLETDEVLLREACTFYEHPALGNGDLQYQTVIDVEEGYCEPCRGRLEFTVRAQVWTFKAHIWETVTESREIAGQYNLEEMEVENTKWGGDEVVDYRTGLIGEEIGRTFRPW